MKEPINKPGMTIFGAPLSETLRPEIADLIIGAQEYGDQITPYHKALPLGRAMVSGAQGEAKAAPNFEEEWTTLLRTLAVSDIFKSHIGPAPQRYELYQARLAPTEAGPIGPFVLRIDQQMSEETLSGAFVMNYTRMQDTLDQLQNSQPPQFRQ